MKKIIFVLASILALSAFAFSGCDKEPAAKGGVAPRTVEEKSEEIPDDKGDSQIEHEHSDFKFVPKPIKGKAVHHDEFGGEVYIIRFGNRRRHDGGVCPRPPHNPTEPDGTDDGANSPENPTEPDGGEN